jgi:hypothetical protein
LYRAGQSTGAQLIDFENVPPGSPALFQNPAYSGSTDTFLEVSSGHPTFAVVTTNMPSGISGSRVLHVTWSFASGTADPWLRLTTHAAAVLPNPTVSFHEGLCFDAYADRPLFLVLGLRETGAAGPVGSNGGTSGTLEWVGGTTDNTRSPPLGRRLAPGAWTRICFVPPDEPVHGFTGDGSLASITDRGVLEHLALVPDDGSGQYHLYLDNFQTFEAYP